MGRIGTACRARAPRHCTGGALRRCAVVSLAGAVTALHRCAVVALAWAVTALHRGAGGQVGGGGSGAGGRVLDAAWR